MRTLMLSTLGFGLGGVGNFIVKLAFEKSHDTGVYVLLCTILIVISVVYFVCWSCYKDREK